MVDILVGPVNVPNLSGLDELAATAALDNLALIIDAQYVVHTGTPNLAYDQSPAASTEVGTGSTVIVYFAVPELFAWNVPTRVLWRSIWPRSTL